RLQAQGALPPGSFGFAPVLPRNDGALWRGRRCQAGQVVTLAPTQEADHITTTDYEFLGLTVDGDSFRELPRPAATRWPGPATSCLPLPARDPAVNLEGPPGRAVRPPQ